MATVAEIDALADQLRTLAASFGVTNLRHWDDNPGWLVVTPPKTPGQVDAFEQAAFDQLDIDFECLTDDTHEASVLRLDRGRPIGSPGTYTDEGEGLPGVDQSHQPANEPVAALARLQIGRAHV